MADLMRKIEFLSQLAVYKYTRKAKTWVMSGPSLGEGRTGVEWGKYGRKNIGFIYFPISLLPEEGGEIYRLSDCL